MLFEINQPFIDKDCLFSKAIVFEWLIEYKSIEMHNSYNPKLLCHSVAELPTASYLKMHDG